MPWSEIVSFTPAVLDLVNGGNIKGNNTVAFRIAQCNAMVRTGVLDLVNSSALWDNDLNLKLDMVHPPYWQLTCTPWAVVGQSVAFGFSVPSVINKENSWNCVECILGCRV